MEQNLKVKEDKNHAPPAEIKAVEKEHVVNGGWDIASLLPTAGTLNVNEECKAILFAPPDDDAVEIRPDGLIYLPWMEYQTRLNDAFGLQWALIPEGNPQLKDNLVFWKFHMVIHGVYMTAAYGVQEYHPTNRTMNYGDAVEGARSNALMRCCKHLGITKELWKPSFINEWKDNYAVKEGGKWKKVKSKQAPVPIVEPEDDEPKPQPLAPSMLRGSIKNMLDEMYESDNVQEAVEAITKGKFSALADIPDKYLQRVYDIVQEQYNTKDINDGGE